MKSKRFFLLFVPVLLAAALLFHALYKPAGKPKKNIVLITLDGLRADHLSCYGYERPTTPNIDRLAATGLRFKQIITSGHWTKIALTSLFTSLDYRYHKISQHDSILDERFVTLAEALRDRGYATFAAVANPMIQRTNNYHQGFDAYQDFLHKEQGKKFIAANLVATETLDWLEKRDRKKPFFIYCHFEEPHPPWIHPSPWLDGEEKDRSFFKRGCTFIPSQNESNGLSEKKRFNLIAKYDGAIRFADAEIGRIVAKLEEAGLTENTIIAISSDHGFELMDRGTPTHGYCPYDEVVRIPLVIHLGTDAPRPKVSNQMGRIFDIGPTLLDLAGVEVPTPWEGRSLLRTDRVFPTYVFTFSFALRSVRTRHYKLIFQKVQLGKKNYRKPPGYEFYDLVEDPQESRDLSASPPPEFEVMKKELSRYRKDLLKKEFLPGTAIPKKARLDENTKKKLRALGYIR